VRRSLLTAGALLALAPAAASAAPAAPTAARFVADVRTSQVETWSFDRPDDPGDPCDAPSRGGGSQRITGRASGLRVTALSLPAVEGGRPLVAGSAAGLTVPLQVDREGTYAVDYTAGSGSECDTGIFGDDTPPSAPDCGARSGSGTLTLEFRRRDRLDVGIEPGELEAPFLTCPFWVGGHEPEGTGGLSPRTVRLVERRLFRRGVRRIVLHGGAEKCFDESGFTTCGEEQGPMRGRIVTTFALTLRRIR
jgi:hypothetical protein